jgi:hypothetical protein
VCVCVFELSSHLAAKGTHLFVQSSYHCSTTKGQGNLAFGSCRLTMCEREEVNEGDDYRVVYLQRLRVVELTLDHEAPYFTNMRRRNSRKDRCALCCFFLQRSRGVCDMHSCPLWCTSAALIMN